MMLSTKRTEKVVVAFRVIALLLLICPLGSAAASTSAGDQELGYKAGMAARGYLAVIGQAAALLIDEAASLGADPGTLNISHDLDQTDMDADLAPSITGRIRVNGTVSRAAGFSPASPVYTLDAITVTLLSTVTVADLESEGWVTLEQGTTLRFDAGELALNTGIKPRFDQREAALSLSASCLSGNLRLEDGSHNLPLTLDYNGMPPQAMQVEADLSLNVGFEFVDPEHPDLAVYSASVQGPLTVSWNDGQARRANYQLALDHAAGTTRNELICSLDGRLSPASTFKEYHETYAVELITPEAGVFRQDLYAVINRNDFLHFSVEFANRHYVVQSNPRSTAYFRLDSDDSGTEIKDFWFVGGTPDGDRDKYQMKSGKKNQRTFWVMAVPPHDYQVEIANKTGRTIHLEYAGGAIREDSRLITMGPNITKTMNYYHNEIHNKDIRPFKMLKVDGMEKYIDKSRYVSVDNDKSKCYLDVVVDEARDYTRLLLMNPLWTGRIYQLWKGPDYKEGEAFIVWPFTNERRANMSGVWPHWNLRVIWYNIVTDKVGTGRAVKGDGDVDVKIEPYAP